MLRVRTRLPSTFRKFIRPKGPKNVRAIEQNFEQNKGFLRALPAGRISHFSSRIYPSPFPAVSCWRHFRHHWNKVAPTWYRVFIPACYFCPTATYLHWLVLYCERNIILSHCQTIWLTTAKPFAKVVYIPRLMIARGFEQQLIFPFQGLGNSL